MEEKLREYAHLIVSVGLNLQKGQTLILSSPVECAPFARLCASAAYDLGAGEVVLNWTDDYITRERFLRAQDAALGKDCTLTAPTLEQLMVYLEREAEK